MILWCCFSATLLALFGPCSLVSSPLRIHSGSTPDPLRIHSRSTPDPLRIHSGARMDWPVLLLIQRPNGAGMCWLKKTELLGPWLLVVLERDWEKILKDEKIQIFFSGKIQGFFLCISSVWRNFIQGINSVVLGSRKPKSRMRCTEEKFGFRNSINNQKKFVLKIATALNEFYLTSKKSMR